MVKSFISAIVALALLITGAVLENRALTKDFNRLENILIELYDKTETEEATKEDALAVQKWWLNKKRTLNSYIPHDDIKDVDTLLAESVNLIHTKSFNLALAKLEVLIELCEHIPHSFSFKTENIF